MKRIILGLLLACATTVVCMERPPSYAQEPQAQAPSQPAATPASASAPLPHIYTLQIPVPGTAQSVDEIINLQEITDPIAYSTLAELLTNAFNEKKGFIIARITTKIGDTYSKEYYSLDTINHALFKGIFPDPRTKINRYNFLTPLRAQIVGEINYFAFNPGLKIFEHLATDTDLYTINQKFANKQPLSKQQSLVSNLLNGIYNPSIKLRSKTLEQAALHYLNKKEFNTARYYREGAAQLGNAGSMNNLGFMDLNGTGLAVPNYQSAREWFNKAAQLGNAVAMRNLGFMDAQGQGLAAPNYQSAREWLNKAFKANPSPQNKLAVEKGLAFIDQQKRSAPESTEPTQESSEQPAAKKQK